MQNIQTILAKMNHMREIILLFHKPHTTANTYRL